MLDEIDIRLLGQCKAKTDSELIEVIKPFLKEPGREDPDRLSEVQLRERMKRLEENGLVELNRTRRRGRIFCKITSLGRDVLREYVGSHPEGGKPQ